MKRKPYERELRELQGELVAMQEWVKASGAKICIVFEGRDTAGKGGTIKRHHRARQPARLPRRRAARADRARAVADVPAAVHAALPGSRRGRDLRPQLVQPRRRRARDGVLHRGADRAVPASMAPGGREGDGRVGHPAAQVLARGQPGGADPAARRAGSTTHARSGSCRTWTCCPTAAGTTTRGPATRCSPRPTPTWAPWYVVDTDDKRRARLNVDQPPADPGPLRAARASRDEAAPPTTAGRIRAARPARSAYPDALLMRSAMRVVSSATAVPSSAPARTSPRS